MDRCMSTSKVTPPCDEGQGASPAGGNWVCRPRLASSRDEQLRARRLRGRPMCNQCISPTEGLTWDDLCELWDNGVYTTDDIKNIAPLYFEGAELSAVLDVIETVENDSHAPQARATDL